MRLIEAAENNDLELVKKLIKEGYPLNKKDVSGFTALMEASSFGYVEIVKELINAGASLNDKNKFGNTALKLASCHRCVEIAKELIKAGASIDIGNNCGTIAIDYNKKFWQQFEIQDLILTMYPHLYSLLEEKVGIHKDILLKLKMNQILELWN